MLSIRVRVLAATLGLVLVGLLISGAAVYGALEWFLIGRLQQQTESLEGPVVNALNFGAGGGTLTDEQLQGVIPPGGFVRFVENQSGSLLYSYPPMKYGKPAPDPQLPSPLPGGDQRSWITVPSRSGGAGYMVDVAPVGFRNSPGPAPYRLVIGLSLHDTNTILHEVLLIEVLVGASTLGAIGLAGFWIVRLGLRPLDRMAATASRITAGDLAVRVADSDPRTEIGRLGAALNVMLSGIEEAFRQRQASEDRLRRFVADASHELRTPLTSVRGYAELFRRGADRRPEDLAMAMRRIEDEAKRMSRLVDEMLLLARLDQRRPLRQERVDLSALAAEAVDACRAADPGRQVELQASEPVVVVGDPERLRQVLDNLLANVRVHTPPGTPATVSVRDATSGLPAGPAAVVEVTDQGPGIDPAAGARVFERFFRADAGRSRDRGGYGLGLSIVAAIVDAHGGRCELESAPGRGATFRLILPRPAAQPAAPSPDASADRTSPGRDAVALPPPPGYRRG
ncbi:MAG: HAMP domain-containing histidine kinase [Candidatus Dormibacteraeota bacterium]|nr:HAMP domain-containing histidine kinase [Candidatus Dormibacteraeota bacterium]